MKPLLRPYFDLAFLLASGSLGLVACATDDDRPINPGSRSDAGPDLDAGIDGSVDPDGPLPDGPPPDAPMEAAGPIVTILNPTEPSAGDLSSEAIVTDNRVTVRCQAETNPETGDRVNAESVTITVVGDGGDPVTASAIPTGTPDIFQASVNLANFGNGALDVVCTAADRSAEARQNSDTVATFLDLGPTIEILAPFAGSSAANQTDVVFVVSESPVAAGDTQATPDFANVELRVAGTLIPNVQEQNGTYTATIDFDGPLFDPALVGLQSVQVDAPNTRGTVAVSRRANLTFTVDNEGPEIDITTPEVGELVSGVISISAVVTDPTGVQEDSVVATVSGNEVALSPFGGDTYTGLFDTRILGPVVFPNVIVRALDITGNQSSTGYLIGLDNATPIISLDSPHLREGEVDNGDLLCSRQFDPLGEDAVNDGQGVLQLFEVRARLEDRSNSATDTAGVVVPIAHVDEESVELFLLDDETQALIVDTDGDGICDDVNPLLVPTSVPSANNEVAVVQMAPIPTGGSSFFGTDAEPLFVDTENAFCTEGGDESPPPQICISTPLTRVISTVGQPIDVIYGVPPLADLQCAGNGIDALAMNMADGWACLGVRGADNLGNLSVSPPIRICIDSDASEDDGCPAANEINFAGSPECTGTYDPNTDTVDPNTPCVLDDFFEENEVRRIDL